MMGEDVMVSNYCDKKAVESGKTCFAGLGTANC
jgi:hypothetical protein